MRCASLLLLAPLLVAQNPAPRPAAQDLTGWRGDPAVWTARDGCLVGSTVGHELAGNSYLVLEGREPGDFVFDVDVRVEGDNHVGVQYRGQTTESGDVFTLSGPRCNVHATANYLAMCYDERGAGDVARQGQFVARRQAAGGDEQREVIGALAKARTVDLTQWHHLRIVARGELCWHELDGAIVTAVQDRRIGAPRRGCIALMLHAGHPVTAWFKNPALRELSADAAAAADAVVVPDALRGLLRRQEVQAKVAKGDVPQWLWDEQPGSDEELFFRRTFTLDGVPDEARLALSCDNHCRVYVNGEKVGQSDTWEAPLVVDVRAQLRAGENVIGVHGWNEGGPAGLAVRFDWRRGAATGQIVSDADWRCSGDDPDGWNEPQFAGTGFGPVRVLGALGGRDVVWTRALGADSLGSAVGADAPQVAVVETALDWHGKEPAPQILELLRVPRSLGSWVSLAVDPRGRLYASDQRSGLYRVTPAQRAGELSTIERVPVTIGGCQGMLWFRDSLYAVENGKASGLYRLTDTDGDDVLDKVELLRALDGEGEHGPHAVIVAPDGQNLLVLCGNQVRMPQLAASRVPTDWAEDRLLPRLDDPNPYWEGHSPPGGWVCQVDPDGKNWELICCGFRNPYDLAITPRGDILTYDADMEWDMGMPWYRPTRLLRVADGADYGWRIGNAKWPADWPDSPPAVLDIGPGSPTGVLDWHGRLLVLDWTFGTVYSNGEPLLTGAPWPVADLVASPRGDGVYLVAGGRGTASGLWFIPLPTSTVEPLPRPARPPLAAPLGELLGKVRGPAALDLQPLLDSLGKVPFAPLSHLDRIAWLRLHALALLRRGPATDAQRALVAERLLPLFPSGDERVDADLAELLAYVDAPGFLDKAVPQLSPMRPSPAPPWAEVATRNESFGGVIQNMLAAMPPVGQLAIANALRTIPHGWTLEQRRALFTFLAAARTRRGGSSYDGYVKKMIDAAWATCTPAEQDELAEIVGMAKADAPKFRAQPPKGPGRAWTVAEGEAALRDRLDRADLTSGHNLFHAVGCAGCHYFAGEGGNHGPDLTSLGGKFAVRDVLDSILEPSKVVSDQYSGSVLTKKDGTALFGVVSKTSVGTDEVYEVFPAVVGAAVVRVPAAEVAKVERSPLSPMPTGLVDSLSADELRDLVGFLLSRGKR